ncbi:hypothetical protein [Paraprevotella clara]|uniref:hypothetical protein n=1 Tax=Paraprevotella clara TaxID=454154 RepID=UPI0026704C74|nr:hypothetical protein [Paraprevotella clara]
MNGREDKKLNDLFFVCSLIEYVGRQTKNERKVVVNALGRKGLEHYYELAEVYHCENINKVTGELLKNTTSRRETTTMWWRRKVLFLRIGMSGK